MWWWCCRLVGLGGKGAAIGSCWWISADLIRKNRVREFELALTRKVVGGVGFGQRWRPRSE